jgi:hypothetical protein
VDLAGWQRWWKRSGGADVRRILMDEWDPIGVRGIPEAADEYDSYVGVVGRLLREGADADALRAYLTDVRESRMGFGASAQAEAREQLVANRLVEWYRAEAGAD